MTREERLEELKKLTEDIRNRAEGQWDSILEALSPKLRGALKVPGKHVPCPVHGGKDGYRVYKEVADEGRSVCNTCGHFTDGFDTLMWAENWTFRETVREVGRYLGFSMEGGAAPRQIAPRDVPESKKVHKRSDDDIGAALMKTWQMSVPISHASAEPARLYLARRGLRNKPPNTLRFVPSLAYYDGKTRLGDFGCIIATFESEHGAPVTIHRTYITSNGYKADVPSPKKYMEVKSDRKMVGGAFRMSPLGRILGVSEGIENGIACQEVYGIPVWPCLDAYLLENWAVPDGVERVIVFADKDRPSLQHPKGHGQESARNLVLRLWKEGVQAMAICPVQPIPDGKKGIDWLDVYHDIGPDAFPSLESIHEATRKVA